MSTTENRFDSLHTAIHRPERKVDLPQNTDGSLKKLPEYYGENIFDFRNSDAISEKIKKNLLEVSSSGKLLNKDEVEVVANAVTDWAISRGVTHFCHWFQPLTGWTAEKHDAFLRIDAKGKPFEKLSASQLMQGEPDASSFPNGGSRSTFEARGYTSWDLTSPLFIIEGPNGKTLCIPTAFVAYHGEALDIKTPLLRSVSKISEEATRFMNLVGESEVKSVNVSAGCEQEYFLIDKAFYFARPDLVMTGRTMFGELTAKHQQLDDHYFGDIPDRALSFMQELDLELHRLGIPAKTRHNEVAPGQFELAPIFKEANVSSDHNQIIMALIKKIAEKHNFAALLHEKPFANINGSGKHMNWSMLTDTGVNMLEPGDHPHQNMSFLAIVAIVVEAVNRHEQALRMAIAGHGNDHRLGANEAPPSIISVFLGDTISKIFDSFKEGKTFTPTGSNVLDMGAQQLAHLLKDNTDRNRTSPFAFTGNKFEFRAVGSSQAVGFPITILNAAVASVLNESNSYIEAELKSGRKVDEVLRDLTVKWISNAGASIFNGDGYSEDWVVEAEKRGLANLKTSADAYPVLKDLKQTAFLTEQGIYNPAELETRYNVLTERYILCREIEFNCFINLVNQNVLPSAIEYKRRLGEVIVAQKSMGLESSVESDIYKKLNSETEALYSNIRSLKKEMDALDHDDEAKTSLTIANKLMPISLDGADICSSLERLVPNDLWSLPKYYDMLFLR
ncbi:MAG: glutamine synthetase type III [Halobacteriovoraceae bacterium]|nr:glutamine synthetase type III [Halobacteriovoraceae bacterium]MBT5095071.1 glutamine synthetase type III [Halobacteriovoraceae bacterium]